MADKKRAPAKSKKTKTKISKTSVAEAPLKTEEEMQEEQAETSYREPVETTESLEADQSLMPSPNTVPTQERPGPGVRVSASDEYTLQTYFDKTQRQFVASVVEFPELKVTGTNRQMVISELQEKIEDHLFELKSRGQCIAEPVQARIYPERLDVAVSQSLYRKLDLLSRQEKLPIDRLVSELLANALGKRPEGGRPPQNRAPQHQHSGQHQGNHQNQNNRHSHNRHHGGQQRHQQRGGNMRDMDSRENFMEYVRNLEKGGGSNWKKR